MSMQDANQAMITIFCAGIAVISENIFEIIGAVGVGVNLVFVAKSFLSKKKVDALDTENKLLEQKLLRLKLKEAEDPEEQEWQ